MSTYPKIQIYVAGKYGWIPQTCWIANAKELSGLKVKRAWNRGGEERENPCPPDKVEAIWEALEYFEMI